MASRTSVVLNLVGPYTLHGEPVIEACIASGAHYADLTGEIPFVRQMIDAAQERAEKAGVKIVNVSGFEALPADLAVALAADTARERWSEELASRRPRCRDDHARRSDQALRRDLRRNPAERCRDGRPTSTRRRSPTRRR